MRVLFLAHRIPYPPNKGDKIRAFHELRALGEAGHEVHLLTLVDAKGDLAYRDDIARFCSSVAAVPLDRRLARLRALAHLAGATPLSVAYFASSALRRRVDALIRGDGVDAAFVYSSSMLQYVPASLFPHTVVDLVDADSEKWHDYAARARVPFKWIYALEFRRLRQYEKRIVRAVAHTIVTTEREAAVLRGSGAGEDVSLHAIVNGVDCDYFRPIDADDISVGSVPPNERGFFTKRSPARLVFTGAMDYYANVDAVRYFVKRVLPLVRTAVPEVEFLIVGSNPSSEVRRLERSDGVRVTGTVRDVRPYVASSAACVLPLRIARGVQNKLLEAMASGRPVVATEEAIAALPLREGEHVLVGRTDHELADRIVMLLRDDALRRALGERARQFVLDNHRWSPALEQIVRLVESVSRPGWAEKGRPSRGRRSAGVQAAAGLHEN